MTKELLKLCQDMVAIASINPQDQPAAASPYGEEDLAKFVHHWLEGQGLNSVLQTVGPRRQNVVAEACGNDKSKTLLLCAHLDTVDVKDMTIPPFDPVIREGRLYGRGSCDTKASLAAMMMAFRHRVHQGNLPYNLALLASCGEEYDTMGADYYLQQTGSQVRAVVIGEPTRLRVVTAHKGIVRFELAAGGKSAHSSNPHLGENAIVKLLPALSAMELFTERLRHQQPHLRLGCETLALTLISGGRQINIIPDHCAARFDWRILPGRDSTLCLEEIRRWLDQSGCADIGVHLLTEFTGMHTDDNHPFVRELTQIAGKVTQHRQTEAVHYATDASAFAGRNIPTPILGPGDIAQAHSACEYVEIEQLAAGLEVYQALLASAWKL